MESTAAKVVPAGDDCLQPSLMLHAIDTLPNYRRCNQSSRSLKVSLPMGAFSETIQLLSAIGTCHACLREVAQRCRGNTAVTAVTHWFDVHEHDAADKKGFRIEEYVSAELTSGEATDWCVELVGSEITSQVHLVVDIRRYSTSGHEARDVVIDKAYAALPELAEALCSAVAKLAQIAAVG